MAARLLLLSCLLLHAAGQDGDPPGPYIYNSYMASLTTSPQSLTTDYGHVHTLTQGSLPVLAQANAQVSLLSMDPCSAYAPHYQTDAAELMYIRAGRADVVLMVDGAPMQRYLFPGDLVAVPPGTLHSVSNSACEMLDAIMLSTSAEPWLIYPMNQLLGLPPQAIIASWGLSSWQEFKQPIQKPPSALYSLNDAECLARCNLTSAEPAPTPTAQPAAAAATAAAGAAAERGNGTTPSEAGAAQPDRRAANATQAGGGSHSSNSSEPQQQQQQQQQQPEQQKEAAAAASAPGPAPAGKAGRRRLQQAGHGGWGAHLHHQPAAAAAAETGGSSRGGSSGSNSGSGGGGGGGGGGGDVRSTPRSLAADGKADSNADSDAELEAGSGKQKVDSKLWVLNDYMASLIETPVDTDSEYAQLRTLTYKDLPAMSDTNTEVAWLELRACSMVTPHFQTDADEFLTVLTGTIDVLLLVNGTSPRLVVRTLQPGDVVVIPRGVTHYLANANCEDTSVLGFWNNKAPTIVFPVYDLMGLPSSVVIAAFGLQGGAAAYPPWALNINVPADMLASLNDPTCTARCEKTERRR